MKILLCVQKPQRRGPEIIVRRLRAWFEKAGHRAQVLYLYEHHGENPLPPAEGEINLGGNEFSSFERFPSIHPGLFVRFRSAVTAFGPDVVQVNGSRSVKYGALLKALSRPGWKLLYRNIDDPEYWVRGALRKRYYANWIMPQMDGVLGVSPLLNEKVRRFYGLKVPCEYVPPMLDPDRLQPESDKKAARKQLREPADAPTVLFMGALTRQKRPDRFIEVIHALRQRLPRVRGWVVGDGPERRAVERRIAELGLDTAVRLWGYQSSVAPFVWGSDVHLVTSDSDGIPTVIQESAYCRLPTVATEVGGVSDVVLDGETGRVCPPEVDALQEAVHGYLVDPLLADRVGERARARAIREFTVDAVGARHLAFYERVLDGPAS